MTITFLLELSPPWHHDISNMKNIFLTISVSIRPPGFHLFYSITLGISSSWKPFDHANLSHMQLQKGNQYGSGHDSRNCGCLVTWFCYQLIEKPGNETAAVSWPDPYGIHTAQKKFIGNKKVDYHANLPSTMLTCQPRLGLSRVTLSISKVMT